MESASASLFAGLQEGLARIAEKTRRWSLAEWSPFAIVVQSLLITLFWIGQLLWPRPQMDQIDLNPSTEMTFIEYQEVQQDTAAQTQDLSEDIQEVEKQKDEVNWENAVDPALDPTQRFTALLDVNKGPEDYPGSARNANLGRVTVAVRLYIDANGRIRDVRIRDMRSPGDAHKPFETDFRRSVRNLLLNKTRLKNKPYTVDGQPRDFVWDTRITFTLDR